MLIVLSTVVSAIATLVIGYYTKRTHDIYKKMNESQDRFQDQLSDLYQAIVISTLLSANSSPEVLPSYISRFKEFYKGKTEIFKK